MNDLSAFQHVLVEQVHLILSVKNGYIHLISHGSGKDVRDSLNHLHFAAVLLHDIIMAHDKILTVSQAGKGAEGMFAYRYGGMAESDHIGPDLVHVGAEGKIDHVRCKTAAWAHVNFQSNHIAFLAQPLVVA